MEKFAYDYATEQGYDFPKYEGRDGIMAMKDLFNMTAGTSTGSIIAAGLSYPAAEGSKEPGFFALDLLKIYSERGDEIFMKTVLSWGAFLFWILFFIALFGLLGLGVATFFYNNPRKIKEYERLLEDIEKLKQMKNTSKKNKV